MIECLLSKVCKSDPVTHVRFGVFNDFKSNKSKIPVNVCFWACTINYPISKWGVCIKSQFSTRRTLQVH